MSADRHLPPSTGLQKGRNFGLIVFTGLMNPAISAFADDDDVATRHTEAPPSSPPNSEADAPISNQAKSKGFIEDSHFNLLFRSYTEHFEADGIKKKDASVLGNQAGFESGDTRGL